MIGAEILAMVAIVVGGAFGIRAISAWATSHKEHVDHALKQEELMRHAMHEALHAQGYEPIDEFLAEWGYALSKDEKKRLEEIRTSRFILDEK